VATPSDTGWVNWETLLGEVILISSACPPAGRRVRTILLAGLVSFTLIGSGGAALAVADPTTPPPESSAAVTTTETTPESSPPSEPSTVDAPPEEPADPPARAQDDFPPVPVLAPPKLSTASGCDNGTGFAEVDLTNPNDVTVEYTVALVRAEDPGTPVQSRTIEVAAGKTEKVGFDDVAGGSFKILVKSSKEETGTVSEEFGVDRCNEIGPIDDPLQVFVRCQNGEGLVTIRVFNTEGDSRTFTVSVDDLELPGEVDLGQGEFAVVVDELPTPDGTFVVRVKAEGIDHPETVNVACAPPTTTPPTETTTTTTTTTTTPVPQAAAAPASGGGALASTGAAVGGIAVLGLIAFGLGALLLIAGRRRRVERTDGSEA
jgi:hypothetical protein